MADLKTGYVVGAIPKKQQIVELIATGIGGKSLEEIEIEVWDREIGRAHV